MARKYDNHGHNGGYDNATNQIKESLFALGLSRLHFYLIHLDRFDRLSRFLFLFSRIVGFCNGLYEALCAVVAYRFNADGVCRSRDIQLMAMRKGTAKV